MIEPAGADPAMSQPPPPGQPWTVLHMVLWSADYLQARGVERARLDAEHLLAHATGVDRLQLYLQFDRPLSPDELDHFRPLLRRRARREPLQYVMGTAAFRELELGVDPRVLIPRPETEELVDLVLTRVAEHGTEGGRFWEIGTGSGAIGLSLANEGRFASGVASDASADALAVARANAEAVGVPDGFSLDFRLGSLDEVIQQGELFDVVVSNPPYVGDGERTTLAPEVVDFEPELALFAGADGLDVVRPLVTRCSPALRPGGLLAIEIGSTQGEAVRRLLDETTNAGTKWTSCEI